MKVALVQFCPTPKDVEGNLRKLAGFVQEAAKAGAKLVVLPELATTGYSFMSKGEAAAVSEPVPDGRTFKIMKALAEKLSVHIVWGMVERDTRTDDLYNSQVIVTPVANRGQSYHKVNLWGNDWLWAAEGKWNPPVLHCDFGGGDTRKVGLLICRDVRDKKDSKWSDFYESGDADLVAFSSNWGNGGFPAVAWIDFVKDNKTTLLVSNRWGKEVPNDFGEGGVCAITADPFEVKCDGLVWSQDCIVYAEV